MLLVPGMVSNSLQVKKNGEWITGWVSPERILQNGTRWLLCMSLDMTTATLKNGTQVASTYDSAEVRVHEGLDGIAALNPGELPPIDLWRTFIEQFNDDYSLAAFNYDWRRWGDPKYAEECVDSFKHHVETCSSVTRQQVTIVGHSMGAFVTFYCMSILGDKWCKKYISECLIAGPAAVGTPALFPSYATGPLATIDIIPSLVEHKLAHITSSWPCMAAEFPHGYGGVETFDPNYVFVQTPSRQYKLKDVPQFLEDTAKCGEGVPEAKLDFGKKLWPGVELLSKAMKTPAVPVHLFYSAGQNTACQWLYSSDNLSTIPTATANCAGDGTITSDSVERMGKAWQAEGKAAVHLHKSPPGETHSSLIKCQAFFDLTEKIMAGEDITTVQQQPLPPTLSPAPSMPMPMAAYGGIQQPSYPQPSAAFVQTGVQQPYQYVTVSVPTVGYAYASQASPTIPVAGYALPATALRPCDQSSIDWRR